LSAEKRAEFRDIFTKKNLNATERATKLKAFLETLDDKQLVAYEHFRDALRNVQSNATKLPHLSAENQLLLKKYDALEEEKKRLSVDAKQAHLVILIRCESFL
uniref:Protein CASP n=1 Tax=Anisakis simplex TaxID=6269 RepID=A0A0M3KJP6_ANISI